MGNLTFCGQVSDRPLDGEVGAMELMFPSTAKEIELSRALMRALDEMSSHRDLDKNVREAFGELYGHYQWQMEQGYP